MRRSVLLLLILSIGFSCRESVDLRQLQNYDGPTRITTGMEVYRSDSAVVKVKVNAEQQLVFDNGNSEFPKGILIHFFDDEGKLTSTIQADKGFQNQKDKIYRGEGDVRVHNLENGTKLNSEELYWDERNGRIFTEKFVTVTKADGTVIPAKGMESDEALTDITFFEVTDGTIPIPEENGGSRP
ncbi:LPS export ABC transporter periplasmic protein LptC [Echinicola shivajiensis]|uniref:LPS export ABC transporter periplasmic protein LptC n=1 Tax=Echinicola shivajiensis TaxID=1035916 RepID=UPI001BFC7C5E|nr:LPS export ABC transporter periplasmic protein LptC [Echinicola shivajiensis]